MEEKSEEDEFYIQLENKVNMIPANDKDLIIGSFNAQIVSK